MTAEETTDQLNQNALSEFRADEVNDDIFGSLNGLLLKHLIAQRLTVFTGCTNVVYQESNVCDAALALVELGQNARLRDDELDCIRAITMGCENKMGIISLNMAPIVFFQTESFHESLSLLYCRKDDSPVMCANNVFTNTSFCKQPFQF